FQNNGEIADLTRLKTRMNGYLVQDVVGQDDSVISPPPSLSINNVSQRESDVGLISFTFTVTASWTSVQPVTVNWNTVDGTATVAGNDYIAASGILTFNPGQTSQTIRVQVVGDTTSEPDENFLVTLSNVSSNATIGHAQGIGTVINDDPGQPIKIVGGQSA